MVPFVDLHLFRRVTCQSLHNITRLLRKRPAGLLLIHGFRAGAQDQLIGHSTEKSELDHLGGGLSESNQYEGVLREGVLSQETRGVRRVGYDECLLNACSARRATRLASCHVDTRISLPGAGAHL